MRTEDLASALAAMPLVAILRGIRPKEAVATGEAIVRAGIRVIEVPLNSPAPFDSIGRLSRALSGRAVIGAGTVLTTDALDAVADAGGVIAVTPNTNPAVIARALERGVEPIPGFLTPTEAFAAVAGGARYLKLFPPPTMGLGYLPAISAVLPNDAKLLAVGGISASNAADWLGTGATALGIGSDIYRPGDSMADVATKAERLVAAIRGGAT